MSNMLKRLAPIVIVLTTVSGTALADEILPDARLAGYPQGKNVVTQPSVATAWFLLVGLGLVAIGPVFLNAHRTHLD